MAKCKTFQIRFNTPWVDSRIHLTEAQTTMSSHKNTSFPTDMSGVFYSSDYFVQFFEQFTGCATHLQCNLQPRNPLSGKALQHCIFLHISLARYYHFD